jgi:hypothetical protein
MSSFGAQRTSIWFALMSANDPTATFAAGLVRMQKRVLDWPCARIFTSA